MRRVIEILACTALIVGPSAAARGPSSAVAQSRNASPAAGAIAPVSAPEIRVNDNRAPAGQLKDGVLSLRLEATTGVWRPEGTSGAARTVHAFAAEGSTPQIPGPLLRVREGTALHVTVSNRIPGLPLKLYGMASHPGDPDASVDVAPGGVREFRFKAGVAGTYYYWGATSGAPINQRDPIDSQLVGAFVVEPLRRSQDGDRIFVMTEWLGPVEPDGVRKVSFGINGRSWPMTERLTLPFGQAVEWRVINASVAGHPMHLHGTFYTVESRGNATRDVIYGAEGRRLVTTEMMEPGGTMMMRWVPDRVGNWLFHCHILAHVSGLMRLADLPPAERAAAAEHAEHDLDRSMAGLVLGITVRPGDETAAPDLEPHERRRLKLVLQSTPARYGTSPGFGFALADHNAAERPIDPANLSPAIVLTRGEPVAIAVINRLDVETAIHWHGIELESFHDGVPGWSGQSGQIMPPVRPGETFDVRFTPPRAGTFIYHTHGHDNRQLSSGLYGPLIVVEPGHTFDPAVERIVLLGAAGPGSPAIEINRSTNPAPWQLRAGVKHRFRLINITTNYTAIVSLRGESGVVQWKAISKDGADLPPAQAALRPARQTISVGETYDFEYEPAAPGELRLEALRSGANGVITTALVRVVR